MYFKSSFNSWANKLEISRLEVWNKDRMIETGDNNDFS